MALIQPYKSLAILVLQSSFLINLTLLSGFVIFAYTYADSNKLTLQSVAVGLSTGVAFLQFCGIVLYAIIVPRCSCPRRQSRNDSHSDDKAESMAAVIDSHSVSFRDSIFEESQKLLPDDPNY